MERPASPRSSPLDAFQGTIARTETTPLYRLGLAVVAFAMVLLPLVYLSLIGLTVWGVLWHLSHDTWILEGGSRGGIAKILIYLGPAVIGGILVIFMIKPLYARRSEQDQPITLDPANEPLLFTFVQKVCSLVGAPFPCRIQVDCQVNASASLSRGLLSRDLVLTIGLPLAAGLDMRQFAGVLAHEFGHFAQGAGMRLTYVIRRINAWFARVVYERDEWDDRLDRTARGIDLRLGIFLHAACGCVWLTRRILWVLMHAGTAISCFMLRQMEYDADSYEAKIAGSDASESTSARMRVLAVATQSANAQARESWASHRLPENMVLLIEHKAGSFPAEVLEKISGPVASEKTRWFHTHPCDPDRVRTARALNQKGIFRLQEPAKSLFSDFASLSRTVTKDIYVRQLKLEFTEKDLMPAEELLRESEAANEAGTAVRRFCGGVNLNLCPLFKDEAEVSGPDLRQVEQARADAAVRCGNLLAEAEKRSTECWGRFLRLSELICAHRLAKAGFKFEPKNFGLSTRRTAPADLEQAARMALDEAKEAIRGDLAAVEPFFQGLRQRVDCAIRLLELDSGGVPPAALREMVELRRLLAAVGAEIPGLHETGSRLRALVMLAQSRPNHPNPGIVDHEIAALAKELEDRTNGIQQRLTAFRYPFPHAKGELSIAEFARPEKHDPANLQSILENSQTQVDRLLNLHYRLVGCLLVHADRVESRLPSGEINPQSQEIQAAG
jgi:Zn-dependent protease with chaperone function